MCLRVGKILEKNMKIFFVTSLKSLKKEVGSGVGSRSIGQRSGSADPDPHQNVTDPQHWQVDTHIEAPSMQIPTKKEFF
jgi:hypothetical protein